MNCYGEVVMSALSGLTLKLELHPCLGNKGGSAAGSSVPKELVCGAGIHEQLAEAAQGNLFMRGWAPTGKGWELLGVRPGLCRALREQPPSLSALDLSIPSGSLLQEKPFIVILHG